MLQRYTLVGLRIRNKTACEREEASTQCGASRTNSTNPLRSASEERKVQRKSRARGRSLAGIIKPMIRK